MKLADYQDPDVIRRILQRKTIAIVGLSGNELRASNFVGRYLMRNGYTIIPVNPREDEILGQKSWASLTEIPGKVDTVDVFRAPDAAPGIAREAVEIGASAIWFQFGVISEEAVRIAVDGGLDVVVDRCLKVEHARHLGRMHWVGLNTGRISANRI
jgi:predicted CoA-binding protein